jgi:hypothetical protein
VRPTQIAALLDFDLAKPRLANAISDPKVYSNESSKALEIFRHENEKIIPEWNSVSFGLFVFWWLL